MERTRQDTQDPKSDPTTQHRERPDLDFPKLLYHRDVQRRDELVHDVEFMIDPLIHRHES